QLGKSVEEVLADYVAVIALVDPPSVPRVVPTDADDDQIVACALAAQAALIVSGDHDLLDLIQYRGMPIVTPAAALQRLTT
ncbi:MAG: PIN domain-containing protein, partial [Gammaproteobacteria bacterium]